MEHQVEKNIYQPNRLGFHYFPDTEHFGQTHLNLWLPVLQEMNVGWLVLRSPLSRAIPEDFIRPLVDAGIEIVVDFQYPFKEDPDWAELEVLLSAYGKWGVDYALLDREANMRASWTNNRWADPALISNHSERFLKFAGLTLQNTIRPVLGPLVPGGDYWDTAYFKTLLGEISSQASAVIQANMMISAYGWNYGKSLDWGLGGPNAWPNAAPYKQPGPEDQNQQGFRSYEWVDSAVRSVFGHSLPLMMFEVGLSDQLAALKPETPDIGSLLNVYGLTKGQNVYDPESPGRLLAPLPSYVKSINYYVLSASQPDQQSYCWFRENGQRLPLAQAFYTREGLLEGTPNAQPEKSLADPSDDYQYKYRRYILVSDQLLDNMQQILETLHPLMESDRPLVGFSVDEACGAAFITYVSPDGNIDQVLETELSSNGNLVKVVGIQELSSLLLEKNYAIE